MGQLPDFRAVVDEMVERHRSRKVGRWGALKRKIETALKYATLGERRRAIAIARKKARDLQGLDLGLPGAKNMPTARVAREIAEEIASGETE